MVDREALLPGATSDPLLSHLGILKLEGGSD